MSPNEGLLHNFQSFSKVRSSSKCNSVTARFDASATQFEISETISDNGTETQYNINLIPKKVTKVALSSAALFLGSIHTKNPIPWDRVQPGLSCELKRYDLRIRLDGRFSLRAPPGSRPYHLIFCIYTFLHHFLARCSRPDDL